MEQHLDQRRHVDADLLRQVGQRGAAGEPDGLPVALPDAYATDLRRLHLVELLTTLLLRLATTTGRTTGATERTLGAATTATAAATAGRRTAGTAAGATTTGRHHRRLDGHDRRPGAAATTGARPPAGAAELAGALLGHHRRVGPRHARTRPDRPPGRRGAAGRRTRAAGAGRVCGAGRGARRLAHALRRGERVVTRARGPPGARGPGAPPAGRRSSRDGAGGRAGLAGSRGRLSRCGRPAAGSGPGHAGHLVAGPGVRCGSACGARAAGAAGRRRSGRRGAGGVTAAGGTTGAGAVAAGAGATAGGGVAGGRPGLDPVGRNRRRDAFSRLGRAAAHRSRHCGRFGGLGSGAFATGLLGRRRLARQLLLEPSLDGRLDGGGGGSDELPHVLQHAEDGLAFDSELFRELVDTDLGHCSPCWRSAPEVCGPVSCRACSLRVSHRVVMSVSPLSGSASTDRMQLRTLCLAPGLRLSDRIELKADHLGRSRTIDLGAQRPTHATSFHGTIQTVAARVQIDPATGQGLRRIDHADSVARDDAQQVSLVVSFPASCTHADRPGHPTQVTRDCCLLRFAPRVQRRAHIRPSGLRFAPSVRQRRLVRLSTDFPGRTPARLVSP